MPVIKLILCPVDFTDTAALGAREAASLARAADAELMLVHALPEPWLSDRGRPGYSAPIVQQYELLARRKLEEVASALSSLVEAHTALVHGPVDEAIAQAAIKYSADLIVMGTRARKGIARLLTDSTTEKVMRRARVPVVRVCPAVRPTQASRAPAHGTVS